MSVVEREVVVTERERRARVLEAAALEIDVRGWAQGLYEDEHGAVCMRGAINCIMNGTSNDDRSIPDFADLYRLGTGIALWNDQYARDAEDVKFVLRWRAEEIRDGR